MPINLQQLKDEFSGKSNHQAYELAFAKRLMRPDLDRPGTFLGNTQRQEFLPSLRRVVAELPANCQVFDIGAGKGDALDLALHRLDGATINLLEPNTVMLEQYRQSLARCPNLQEGLVSTGKLQDYYLPSGAPRPAKKQNLVLAIHILYHVTNFHDAAADPVGDIKKAFCAMYDFLAPGGVLFHVISNQLHSSTGHAARYFFRETGKSEIADRLQNIARAREQLLLEGGILPVLEEHFPGSNPTMEAFLTESHFYGDGEEDIAAMCITGEIGLSDDDPFDLKKLEVCAKFVESNRDLIGLTTEERDIPQKGMARSNQPQIVSLIRRGT